MNKLIAITLFSLVVLIITSCNQQQTKLDEATKKEFLEKGKKATQALGATLVKQLSAQLKANGPAAAINYCNLNAIAITDSISEVLGVKISRLSHKNRNPKNEVDKNYFVVAEMIQHTLSLNEKPEPTLITEKNKTTYYSPILISLPTCLKCHGNTESDIAPEVLQVINKKYPNDKAIGFKIGELRGLFKVEFDK